MRNANIQNSAAPGAAPMPFDGMGFALDTVRTMARSMAVTYVRAGRELAVPPRWDSVAQPSGYSLLVALGREIRGR